MITEMRSRAAEWTPKGHGHGRAPARLPKIGFEREPLTVVREHPLRHSHKQAEYIDEGRCNKGYQHVI